MIVNNHSCCTRDCVSAIISRRTEYLVGTGRNASGTSEQQSVKWGVGRDLVTAKAILDQIEQTSFTRLKEELVECAIRYARIRADWYTSSTDKRNEIDSTRTRAHNTFIDSCNILSRNMAKAGEDNNWRTNLGEDRKDIGDFACYLHCVLGLRSR